MTKPRYNRRMSTTQRLIQTVNSLRSEGRITINTLAEKTGIHRVRISTILNGHQQTVTLDDAEAIARAVNMTLDEITSGEAVISS